MPDGEDFWERPTLSRREQIERQLARLKPAIAPLQTTAAQEEKRRATKLTIEAHDRFFGLVGRSEEDIARSLHLPYTRQPAPRMYDEDATEFTEPAQD